MDINTTSAKSNMKAETRCARGWARTTTRRMAIIVLVAAIVLSSTIMLKRHFDYSDEALKCDRNAVLSLKSAVEWEREIERMESHGEGGNYINIAKHDADYFRELYEYYMKKSDVYRRASYTPWKSFVLPQFPKKRGGE